MDLGDLGGEIFTTEVLVVHCHTKKIGYVWAGLVRKSPPQISLIQVKES